MGNICTLILHFHQILSKVTTLSAVIFIGYLELSFLLFCMKLSEIKKYIFPRTIPVLLYGMEKLSCFVNNTVQKK